MKPLKVMIVDDEEIIREGFKRLFDWKKHGCELVCEACDGADAVIQGRKYVPDIVFIDINLPILSGLEACRILKEQFPFMEFIIVSGYDEFSYCQEALRLRATEYLLKPVDFDEVGNIIDGLKVKLLEERKESSQSIESTDEKTMFQIIGYIKEHMAEEITLQKLSEEFHLSSNYISKKFKEETGINYLSYLTRLRMDKAKTLLVSTSLSIGEISENVGFRDYRVFTKVFKEWEGMSPSHYRKNKTPQ